MADRETTADADTGGSGALPDAAPAADTPATKPETEPEQTQATGNAGNQSPEAPTPPDSAPLVDAAADRPRRRRDIRPSALVTLAMLGVLAALSIIGGLVFGDSALGKTCVIGLVPAFSIAIGVVANHWISRRGFDQQLASEVQNAMYTTLHLKRSVQYVDDRLRSAQDHLENNRRYNALIEVVRAKTATELSFGTAQQSSRQWESISASGARAAHLLFVEDDDEMRPRIIPGHNPRTVATSGETTVGGDGENE